MNCPRCKQQTLEERTRQGVEIDICEECRGVWLDKGELDRFIEKAEGGAEYHETEERLRDDDTDRCPRRRGSWIRTL